MPAIPMSALREALAARVGAGAAPSDLGPQPRSGSSLRAALSERLASRTVNAMDDADRFEQGFAGNLPVDGGSQDLEAVRAVFEQLPEPLRTHAMIRLQTEGPEAATAWVAQQTGS